MVGVDYFTDVCGLFDDCICVVLVVGVIDYCFVVVSIWFYVVWDLWVLVCISNSVVIILELVVDVNCDWIVVYSCYLCGWFALGYFFCSGVALWLIWLFSDFVGVIIVLAFTVCFGLFVFLGLCLYWLVVMLFTGFVLWFVNCGALIVLIDLWFFCEFINCCWV